MLADLSATVAAEHRRDLLAAAERDRLSAAAAPPAALRQRLGRGLVALGQRVSPQEPVMECRPDRLTGKEAQWKSC